ncbi:hypothetical protein LCGC14_2861430, partial [marine sediment metagenome]
LGADAANQFSVIGPSTFLSRDANPFTLQGSVEDGASAVAFNFDTTVLDSTSFTAGALHSRWVDLNDVVIMSLTPGSLLKLNGTTLDASAASRFDMGFSGQIALRLNSNGLAEFFLSGAALLAMGQISQSVDNNTEIKSVLGGTKAFGFVTNSSGATSAGKGFRFIGVNNASLWDDDDAAFLSIEPAITGFGTGVQRWKINGAGDVFMIGNAATDNAVVDSPDLILRANYDADAGAPVTPTVFDAVIKHDMLTAGASPTSKLSFLVNGAERLALSSAAPATYTRNATVVEDRTLLASASATIINNNNVLAALIFDLKARALIS